MPEKKHQYVEDHHRHEGVLLDIDCIEDNPGSGLGSKLCMNDLWGMLGNLLQTDIVTSRLQLIKLLADPDLTLKVHIGYKSLGRFDSPCVILERAVLEQ